MAITLNGSSGISGVNGSATTPALQGADSNTGIVFGTDTVQVSTGGSARTTVDSSGRLLVGGTTARTNWNDGSLEPKIIIEGASDDDNHSFCIVANSGTSNSSSRGASLVLARTKGTSVGSNTAVASDDLIGKVEFKGGDGTNFTTAADIKAFVDGTPGTDDMPGRLVFSTTADGASSPTERMRITNDGSMRFGQTTSDQPGSGNTTTGIAMVPDGRLFLSAGGTFSQFNRNSDGTLVNITRSSSTVGSIGVSSSATSFNTSSDYRLKENVVALDGAITRVKQLLPKRFNFIVDADTTVDGFLAHEAQTVVPEAVTGTHNEVDGDNNPVYQGIDQSKLVPLLTAALQEAIGKIEALETKVAALEAA